MYFKVTSSATLTATRTLTIAPNTISRVMWIENATTGGQSIQISQGTGANVTIATGKTAVVYLDGAGSGAAVVDAMAGVSSGASDTLAEILAAGNATGGTDIAVGTGDDITFADSSKAIFGAGSDLQIYHDSSDSYIKDEGTGNLYLTTNGSTMNLQAGSDNMVKIYKDAQVEIFHDASVKLATTSTGVDITGSVTASDMTLSDNTNPTLTITDTTTPTSLALTAGNLSTTIGTTTDHRLKFETNGTERLRIENNGDISFHNSAGTSQALFWDASAESLGIGTTSPAQPIEILKTSAAAVVPMLQLRNGSSSAGSGTSIKFMHSTVSNATSGTCELESIRYSGNLGALTFKTSNNGGTVTERMRVDDTGVGVGTDSPSSILHLSTSDDPKITLTDTGFGASADITGSNGNLRLNSQTATIFDMADSEIARFDSSGNFLVGKTSTTFSVAGVENRADGRITSTRSGNTNLLLNRLSSDGDIVQFYKDGTTVGSIGTLSSALTIGTGDTGIQFNADNNAVMPHNITTGANVDNSIDIGYSSGGTNRRFKDLYLSGNAFIGNAVTSSTDGSSDLKLEGNQHIFRRGSAGSYAEQARIDSSGNLVLGDTGVIRANSQIGVSVEAAGRIYMSRGTSTGGFSHLAFYNGNGQVGTVSSSGSATAYNTSSDQRLKDNIVNAPSASDDIDAIQVRSFDWKINGSHQKYGMVAQELQSVAPEAVSAPEDPEEMMGVDYSKLVPMLVKEIQSLRARVAQLES